MPNDSKIIDYRAVRHQTSGIHRRLCNPVAPADELCVNVFLYTYVYIYIYTYIYTYTHIYLYIYVYAYQYMNIYIYIYVFLHMCVYSLADALCDVYDMQRD